MKPKQYLQRAIAHEEWVGTVVDFETEISDEDFVQPREFWEVVLGRQEGQQANLVYNVAADLKGATARVRRETYRMSS